jgi:hypothetical protein
MSPQIQQFLMQLPEEKREAAMYLRDLILSADTTLTEAIKWRNLTFVKGKTNVAFIYTFPTVDYINLGFFNGTSMDDPKKLLEGTGKGMRHLKVASIKNIPTAQIKKWVKAGL